MPYPATVFEILLAGPGDVEEERREIAEAIEIWTQRFAHREGLVIRPVMWETDTYPELGADPQEIINQQLAGRCDAVIAVFATRLGTATPRAVSGTAEEILRFSAEGKPVAVYFSDGQVDISRIDVNQLQALRNFKDSLKEKGLYRSYTSLNHLRSLIDDRIVELSYRFKATLQAQEPQQVGTKPGPDLTETDMKIIGAIGREIESTSQNRVHSLYLTDTPELSGVRGEDISESIRVLRGSGYVFGSETDSNFNRWEIGLTSDGLELWLLNFRDDYNVRRQIAKAIVIDDIRDPIAIARMIGLPPIVVNHVLQRWVDRSLIIINRLFDGWRIDRFNEEIRQLAESPGETERTEATGKLANRGRAAADRIPRYRTVAEFIGVDVVALSDYGGELGDPIAAAVIVDGWTRLQVVSPSERSTWDAATEERFRDDVRRLAANHDLLDRQGPVRLVFDPPQSGAEKRDETTGEEVERQ